MIENDLGQGTKRQIVEAGIFEPRLGIGIRHPELKCRKPLLPADHGKQNSAVPADERMIGKDMVHEHSGQQPAGMSDRNRASEPCRRII
jgi:hypothetical protein